MYNVKLYVTKSNKKKCVVHSDTTVKGTSIKTCFMLIKGVPILSTDTTLSCEHECSYQSQGVCWQPNLPQNYLQSKFWDLGSPMRSWKTYRLPCSLQLQLQEESSSQLILAPYNKESEESKIKILAPLRIHLFTSLSLI